MWGVLKKELSRENKYLVLIVFLVIILRIPSVFEPYWYGDEGVYQTIGQALVSGEVLYRDIHDNKPPLIYFLSMVGSQPVMRGVLLVWMVASTMLFYRLTKKVFGQLAAGVLTALFGIATSIPFLEGNVANAENFFITTTIGGMWCTWRAILSKDRKIRLRMALVGGIVFGIGSLFKIPAMFDGLAAGVLIASAALTKGGRSYWWAAGAMGLGFIAPWVGVGIFELVQGAWGNFINEAIFQNIGYLSSWGQGKTSPLSIITGETVGGRLLICTVLSGAMVAARKHLSMPTVFSGVWLVWAFFGARLSGRPYAHYFLQVVPPFLLFLGCVWEEKKYLGKMAVLTGIVASTVLILTSHLWFYKTLPYYGNFLGFATGGVSQKQYFEYFDASVPKMYLLASYISSVTMPTERIFIWGDQPSIYALSRRMPVGRFTTAYHVADFDPTQEETMKAISESRPRIIIWMNNQDRPFPVLAQLLAHEYIKTREVGGGIIYQRMMRVKLP